MRRSHSRRLLGEEILGLFFLLFSFPSQPHVSLSLFLN